MIFRAHAHTCLDEREGEGMVGPALRHVRGVASLAPLELERSPMLPSYIAHVLPSYIAHVLPSYIAHVLPSYIGFSRGMRV